MNTSEKYLTEIRKTISKKTAFETLWDHIDRKDQATIMRLASIIYTTPPPGQKVKIPLLNQKKKTRLLNTIQRFCLLTSKIQDALDENNQARVYEFEERVKEIRIKDYKAKQKANGVAEHEQVSKVHYKQSK